MTRSAAGKRLTYVVNYIAADDAQHFVHIPDLLSQLEALGWEIDLVSERGGLGRREVLGRDVTFLSSHEKWRRLGRLASHLLAMRKQGGRLVFVRISKSGALVSALLGRLFGWKTVYWLSGTVEDFNLRRGIRARAGLAGMWVLLRIIDRLATGPETMDAYYARRYSLPFRKIILLYNDINLDRVETTPAPGASGEARVLLVHRLSPVRETDRYFPALLDALVTYAGASGLSVRLDICGDGPERPILERLAQSASAAANIRFHGSIAQRDLDAFYADATIFVMPTYREGFPRVLIEAMARGLPIVATDAGGTRDLCGPAQQNYVIDRDDPDAFGRAVGHLLVSPKERAKLAAENLISVRRFDTPEVARMYDRALSELIGAAPSP